MTDDRLEQIAADLVVCFGDLGSLIPIKLLGEGWGSVAVETGNGLVFRIAKSDVIQKQHKRQVNVLPRIAPMMSIQIPVPEFYAEPSDRFPFGVMGYRKIEGVKLTHSQAESNAREMAKQIAKLLLAFHTFKLTDELLGLKLPGDPDQTQPLGEVWEQASSWLRLNLAEQDFETVRNEWQKIVASSGSFSDIRVLVHGDPWYENLLVDPDGCLVGIVDFDKLRIGDPAIDFGVQQYVNPIFMNDVIKEYRRLGGDPGDDISLRATNIMKVKAIKDLVFCLRINHFYPGTLEKINKAFLVPAKQH